MHTFNCHIIYKFAAELCFFFYLHVPFFCLLYYMYVFIVTCILLGKMIKFRMLPFIILTLLPMQFNGHLVIGSRYKPVAQFINIVVPYALLFKNIDGINCVITQDPKESNDSKSKLCNTLDIPRTLCQIESKSVYLFYYIIIFA